MLIRADTRRIEPFPGQTKGPHGSTDAIAMIAPRHAHIGLQYNPKAELLDPATF